MASVLPASAARSYQLRASARSGGSSLSASRNPRLFMASMLPADYEGTDLEERQVMARWGGQVVLVPLVDGRSTSRLIDSAAAAGA
jgi:hypothetical protein